MADNVSTKNQVKEITDRLEQGMKDLFTSEKYMSYLQTMSRFSKYSTRNTLLIYMQKPDASLVAGYQDGSRSLGASLKKANAPLRYSRPYRLPSRKKNKNSTRTPAGRYSALTACRSWRKWRGGWRVSSRPPYSTCRRQTESRCPRLSRI